MLAEPREFSLNFNSNKCAQFESVMFNMSREKEGTFFKNLYFSTL